jgi:hypothetical protein
LFGIATTHLKVCVRVKLDNEHGEKCFSAGKFRDERFFDWYHAEPRTSDPADNSLDTKHGIVWTRIGPFYHLSRVLQFKGIVVLSCDSALAFEIAPRS